jgi:hydroxymethylpyrimidine pyrophosphatase-like HAD family hydrolase
MYCSALRFHRCIGSQLPLVTYNGAWIQKPDSASVFHHFPLSQSLAKQLLEDLEQTELSDRLNIHFYIDDRLYVRQVTPLTERYAKRSGLELTTVGNLGEILDRPTTKVFALSHEADIIQQVFNH